jgi:uncharacterized membrane protein YedE/YeeE
MNLPLGLVGPVSAMVLGCLFGFVLQRGGLGDSCKLTGQLRLQDWTVFNVMFTAIIVAATGLWILDATGLLAASSTFVPDTNFRLALVGGGLVGLGMSVGGYCPGTSVVAAASGRLDGAVFFVGLIIGTLLFAREFDRLESWIESARPSTVTTLPQLLGISGSVVILALAVVAAAVHLLVIRGARRASAGS